MKDLFWLKTLGFWGFLHLGSSTTLAAATDFRVTARIAPAPHSPAMFSPGKLLLNSYVIGTLNPSTALIGFKNIDYDAAPEFASFRLDFTNSGIATLNLGLVPNADGNIMQGSGVLLTGAVDCTKSCSLKRGMTGSIWVKAKLRRGPAQTETKIDEAVNVVVSGTDKGVAFSKTIVLPFRGLVVAAPSVELITLSHKSGSKFAYSGALSSEVPKVDLGDVTIGVRDSFQFMVLNSGSGTATLSGWPSTGIKIAELPKTPASVTTTSIHTLKAAGAYFYPGPLFFGSELLSAGIFCKWRASG